MIPTASYLFPDSLDSLNFWIHITLLSAFCKQVLCQVLKNSVITATWSLTEEQVHQWETTLIIASLWSHLAFFTSFVFKSKYPDLYK